MPNNLLLSLLVMNIKIISRGGGGYKDSAISIANWQASLE